MAVKIRRWIQTFIIPLMPIWINGWNFARLVQFFNLFARQIPADSFQILLQLFFISCTNNDAGNRGTLQ